MTTTTRRLMPSSTNRYALFINVTNLSSQSEIEVTHIWIEGPPKIHILNDKRRLPKRLKPQETWETWVKLAELPSELVNDRTCSLVQARLSTGTVIQSKKNKDVPSEGYVPG